MKKQKPSTFILNANDVAYFFVEGKNSSTYGPVYCVYHDLNEKPTQYTAKNFVEIYGLSDKQSILNFTKQALLDLTVLNGYNSEVQEAYDAFSSVYSLVQGQDTKSPKLGKLKNKFIDAIFIYNKVKDLLPSAIDISYEEDYLLVTGKLNKKKVKSVEQPSVSSNRQRVTSIVTSYEEQKSVQRKLKYDN